MVLTRNKRIGLLLFFIYIGENSKRKEGNKPDMIDARSLEKELDYVAKIELKDPIVLTYQPPLVEITLTPGMSYDELSEEFKRQTHESSRNGLSSMLSQCDDEIRKKRGRPKSTG